MKRIAFAACLAVLAAAAASPARACTAIASVPYTISSPGEYCLADNISSISSSGVLISVNSSFVTIDLGGHVLESAIVPSTTATGIYAYGQSNITVKNGTLRGFYMGIQFYAPPGSGASRHLVENVRFESCFFTGVRIDASLSTVKNNTFLGVGGTTVTANTSVYAAVVIGRDAVVRGNTIVGLVPAGTGAPYGIYLDSDSGLVEANVIGSSSGGAAGNGICVQTCGNALVVDNRISGLYRGVIFSAASGKYRDNLTVGTTVPFSGGGTDAGGNN